MADVMKMTFFESYYQAAKMIPEERQGAFLMGLLAYAFEGVEPDFESDIERIAFTLTRPNIDGSAKRSATNAANGKANGKSDEKATEKAGAKAKRKATGKAIAIQEKDKDRDRDMEEDFQESFSKEKNSPENAEAGGAGGGGAAPHRSGSPLCPGCGVPLWRNWQAGKWDCGRCGKAFTPDEVGVPVARNGGGR